MKNQNKKMVCYTLCQTAREALIEQAWTNRRSLTGQVEFLILEAEKKRLNSIKQEEEKNFDAPYEMSFNEKAVETFVLFLMRTGLTETEARARVEEEQARCKMEWEAEKI